MHLAQLNAARLLAPIDDPRVAEFADGLEPINALADSAPGFVWRMRADHDDPRAIVKVETDDYLAFTYSVWRSRDELWNFIYRSAHLEYLRRRREWFEHLAEPYSVMWWIPEGVVPTMEDGFARLERLRTHGPGPEAFTFKDFYAAETTAMPRHISSWVPSPQTT
ncbi:DUF3291 domain-containing protein [Nonomuraea sp. NBC_01738]|uniref:DUF3291 domain-containing protein n=1 Tax=Nonomuraea sp. NBC_01738 TaxID=2976003 RepID=UPI002E14F585|nr:DUF3291 domain-containing protein [Nonomuraea sp. NBC_01738]